MRLDSKTRAQFGHYSAVGMGWDYFMAGDGLDANPFPRACEEHEEFRKGWTDAKRSKEKVGGLIAGRESRCE